MLIETGLSEMPFGTHITLTNAASTIAVVRVDDAKSVNLYGFDEPDPNFGNTFLTSVYVTQHHVIEFPESEFAELLFVPMMLALSYKRCKDWWLERSRKARRLKGAVKNETRGPPF